jgi:hypothetical protein
MNEYDTTDITASPISVRTYLGDAVWVLSYNKECVTCMRPDTQETFDISRSRFPLKESELTTAALSTRQWVDRAFVKTFSKVYQERGGVWERVQQISAGLTETARRLNNAEANQ